MSDSNSISYELHSLLECLSRATLLAQPDDVLIFLTRHVEKIINSRNGDFTDPKHEAYCYEEQWGESECHCDLAINVTDSDD